MNNTVKFPHICGVAALHYALNDIGSIVLSSNHPERSIYFHPPGLDLTDCDDTAPRSMEHAFTQVMVALRVFKIQNCALSVAECSCSIAEYMLQR